MRSEVPVTRPVFSLHYSTAFRKAFGNAAVFSRFVSDVLGEPVQVASVRSDAAGRGALVRGALLGVCDAV